jgi:hypothetical protein
MFVRKTVLAAAVLGLFVAVLAGVGYLAEHTPVLVAFIGFGILLVLAATRVEGRP